MEKIRKINVSDEEFKNLYETHTYSQLMELFDCTPMTVWYKVKELNLSKKVGKPRIELKFKDED